MSTRKKAKITRLPVQHPQHPHCTVCKAPLPALDGLTIWVGPEGLGDVEVLLATFRLRCKCGAEWDLTKKVK